MWPEGRFCPHCGSLRSAPIRGHTARSGLYQCSEPECRLQFTVTTKTPLHATKLPLWKGVQGRSEEHTSELQSLMRISSAVFCLQKKNYTPNIIETPQKHKYRIPHLSHQCE